MSHTARSHLVTSPVHTSASPVVKPLPRRPRRRKHLAAIAVLALAIGLTVALAVGLSGGGVLGWPAIGSGSASTPSQVVRATEDLVAHGGGGVIRSLSGTLLGEAAGSGPNGFASFTPSEDAHGLGTSLSTGSGRPIGAGR